MDSNNPLGLEKRPSPYVWVTWLAPYLSGENQCRFSLWNQGNFRVPSSNDMPSDWLVQHQSLLNEIAHDLRVDGYEVEEEDANSLYLKTSAGVTLAGKPDIVARNGKGLVVDVKTGKPRGKDRAQVNLYQVLIPAQRLHGIQEAPWGRLVYRDGEDKLIPPNEVDEAFKQSVRSLMQVVAQTTAPNPQPSLSECRFCKCRELCPFAQNEPPETRGTVPWL
jgi:CRISPR/Cas system-associated exonuclease Cas4 (RecB family)